MVANLPKNLWRAEQSGSEKAGWYELVSNPRWCRMQVRFGAYFLFALIALPLSAASAAGMPDIKSGPKNAVPECATPGRLLAYLKSRNPQLDKRFEAVPGEYMRAGEDLGVRWDYAFYQMLLETGSLSFRNGSRTGDVKPDQNNFAGLGATGRGNPGESFPDIATGVRAHLEHLLLYSGQHLDNPVAERTRKVQQWGVLTQWQAGFTRPITFSDLAAKWAPGSQAYSRMIAGIAQRFQDFCRRPDPQPELLAAVRDSARVAENTPNERPGAVLARRAIVDGKVENNNRRLGLGAQEPVTEAAPAAKTPPTPFKILNAPQPEETAQAPQQPPAASNRPQPQAVAQREAEHTPAFRSGMLNLPRRTPPPAAEPERKPESKGPAATVEPPAASAQKSPPPAARRETKVASAATAARHVPGAVQPGQKCRVWTASYGGQKALIIRSVIDRVVNFTVLDVNEGAEKREADAFIAAYAKNGAVAGEFASQTVALDKAFELCPEG